jgi:DNA-binding NarL/FixJ family response regulator
MKNIVIIEDNEELLKPLIYSIESGGKFRVLKTFSTGEQAVKEIHHFLPNLIIMDIELKGKMNGIECTSILKKQYPQIDVLMLTVFDDSEQVFEALRAGACGYMTKTSSITEIINAIDQAVSGGAPMSNKVARMVLDSFTKKLDSPFTAREDRILNYLARGGSYKTAANELEVSVETIKFHIKNIYIKLHVNNKEDAIELARKNRWV